jgi:hypothetical protein
MPVDHPVILVTGAAGNLGRAILAELDASGAGIVAVDREAAWVEPAVAALPGAARHMARTADLGDPAACVALVAAVLERYGRIDGLAHTVGGFAAAGIDTSDAALFDGMFRLNVLTTVNIVRAVVPPMRDAGRGSIVAIGAGAALAVVAPLVYFFGMKAYQQDRVLIFLNPENDPLGTGYHITQSKIAIGSGGIFGKGFSNGTQSHLDYLPDGHTDFVFATMAEEWGIIGGFFILFLYFMLMRWGLNVAVQSKTRYGKLVAAGLTCTIFFYIMINLLMVVGLAPVAGIPLPLVSHGGSSMLTMMLCVGIIMSIERHPGSKHGQFQ